MAKKKLTPNQQAYQKNIRRIKRFIREKEKVGFSFPSLNLEIPSRVTKKRLRTIEAINAKALYSLSTYHGEATYGEQVEGTEALKIIRENRKESRKKRQPAAPAPEPFPRAADIIIDNFFEGLNLLSGAEGVPTLNGFINRMIAERGKDDVANMLVHMAENGVILTFEIAYKSEETRAFITEALNYLPDLGRLERDKILDELEELEEWASYE